MNLLEKIEILKRVDCELGIWGCGRVAKTYVYPFLKGLNINVDFWADNNIAEGTEIIDGLKVRSLNDIYRKKESVYLIIAVTTKFRQEIIDQLVDNGFSKKQFISIDADDICDFVKELEKLSDEIKKRFFYLYDDRTYLENLFQHEMGYKMDMDNPKTFNEKMQWLKLYDRKEIYSRMVDKASVKDYVKEKIADISVIKTIGKWVSYDEINFDELPSRFVLKCTHDSGSVVVVRDKTKFVPEKYKEKFEDALKRNYFYPYREWPYKNVKPQIIAEEFLSVSEKKSLPVYKFFCFGGKPTLIQTIENDKLPDEVIDYYDLKWEKLELRQNFPNSISLMDKPHNLNKMIEYAKILSEGHIFLRVDFYEINNKVYFSEFTFYSDAGFAKFYPEKWDKVLGDYININD